jgi:hypothetical protein
MPDIPEGAKRPDDHQSAQIKPEQHAEGWDLLRAPIDLEFWEVTDFTALAASIPARGDKITLDAAGLRAVGAVVKSMQEVFAKNSTEFRAWLKAGTFTESAEKVLPLIFEYANALGEALGSEKN